MLFTFGHSTLGVDEALHHLDSHSIDILVDARSHPHSWMQEWCRSWINKWARDHQLGYKWVLGLGGWSAESVTPERMEAFGPFDVDLEPYTHGKFPRQRISKKSGKIGWTNMGFWDYQFFMTTPEFLEACDNLMAAPDLNIAYMCSEAVWWHCHRSMIADYLLWRGHDSVHIQGGRSHSEVVGNRLDRYHPHVREVWEGHAAATLALAPGGPLCFLS